jgi:hypothetical protein
VLKYPTGITVYNTDKGLKVKENINFPLNTTNYKKSTETSFVKKNAIPPEFILSNPNLIALYEKTVYDI